ncbi:Zona pellucida-binding protein 1 [Varanus komodoensis]|nr:Zona pellucida-binding protein 1 [Varanus komodoensis]
MRWWGRRRRPGPSSSSSSSSISSTSTFWGSCSLILILTSSLLQVLPSVHSASVDPNTLKVVGSTNLPVKVYVRLEHNSPRILCVTNHLRNSELIDPIFQWHGPGGDLVTELVRGVSSEVVLAGEEEDIDLKALRTSRKQLFFLQQNDASLVHALRQAQYPSREGARHGPHFEITGGGVLYRVVPARECHGELRQLVIPKPLRLAVLQPPHDLPTAGHLGVEKTTDRLVWRFYWPGVYAQAKRYCLSCPECQKTQGKGVPAGPLIPMPVIWEPFKRIGVDLIEPLERSPRGHQYILVVIDYAIRYPEAVSLRSTSACVIAQELLGAFARVGFPKEILTDQATNFMSQVMRQMWDLLRIRPLQWYITHKPMV